MMNKEEYSWLILQTLPARVKENHQLNMMAGQAKDIVSDCPLMKALWRDCHWVGGLPRPYAIEEESIAINCAWVNNYTYRLPHNI